MFERKIVQIIAFILVAGAAGYAQAQSFVRLLPEATTLSTEGKQRAEGDQVATDDGMGKAR